MCMQVYLYVQGKRAELKRDAERKLGLWLRYDEFTKYACIRGRKYAGPGSKSNLVRSSFYNREQCVYSTILTSHKLINFEQLALVY